MLGVVSLDTVATIALVGGGALYTLGKVAERFGWIRTPSSWKDEAEARQQVIHDRDARIEELERRVAALEAEAHQLRGRPDMTAVIEALAAHEQREERVLTLIADRLEQLHTVLQVAA